MTKTPFKTYLFILIPIVFFILFTPSPTNAICDYICANCQYFNGTSCMWMDCGETGRCCDACSCSSCPSGTLSCDHDCPAGGCEAAICNCEASCASSGCFDTQWYYYNGRATSCTSSTTWNCTWDWTDCTVNKCVSDRFSYRNGSCTGGTCQYAISQECLSSGCTGDMKYWNGNCNTNADKSCSWNTYDCNSDDVCSGGYYKDYGCSGANCVLNSSTCTDTCCDAYYGNSAAYCSGDVCYAPPPPTCSAACTAAGYGNGLCFAGSTTCSSQGYPYASGSNCFYNCSPKTGTDCSGTCLCLSTDSNKPTCDSYSSGDTCYYNGSASCANSGWSSCSYPNSDPAKPSSYYPSGSTCYYNCPVTCTSSGWTRSSCSNNCSTGTCCDCASDGCNHPNTAKCPFGQTCDASCSCQSGCTGILTASISGTSACTVTASLTASNCNGQAWQIKDDGNIKCSGTISGSPYSYTCSSWTVSTGSYVYTLYIGGAPQDSKSATCSATPVIFDFSISISPTSGSVNQGSSISATVSTSLTPGATTQLVSFSVSGLPSGASAPSPVSCSPSCSSVMTISTAATTLTGTYSINVCGTGGGQTHCVVYGLTVTSAGAAITQPSVTTNPATNITQTSATLNGTLNGMGNAASVLIWFEWGLTTSYGNSTPVQTLAATGAFSANLTGLSSNTTYYFKARAKNGGSWQ